MNEIDLKLPEFPEHLRDIPDNDIVDLARSFLDNLRSKQLEASLKAKKTILNALLKAREDNLRYAVKLCKASVEDQQLGIGRGAQNYEKIKDLVVSILFIILIFGLILFL